MPDAPDDVTTAGAPATPQPRSRRRFRIATAALLALFATGIVVWAVTRSSGGGGPAAPHFVDETAASGITQRYTGDGDYFVGGGLAAFDCNGDGLDDLFFAGGAGSSSLFRNESTKGGALRFARVPSPVTDLTAVTGAYPIDIDGDGVTDLVVLRHGPNVVLRGLGGCRFEDHTAAWGIDPGNDWTVGFSATWEGANRLPTLAFGTYRTADFGCGDSRLIRPASAAAATYASPIALHPAYCALSMLFTDWSHTGHRDLRVANDRNYYRTGEEQLWQIRPGVAPREYTEADGWKPLQVWGMGLASQDLNGDGKPEELVTSQGDNKLQTLDAGATGPSFHDMALASGVTAQRPYAGGDVRPSTAWNPAFEDVNNDGVFDLLITKGNVEAEPDYASKDPTNLFLGRSDGTFTEAAPQAGIVRYDSSRGALLVDLNHDGLLDLVVVNRKTNVTVWRNVGGGTAAAPAPMGHWLEVHLHESTANPDAIGAWLDVRVNGHVTTREITIGGGHASGSLGWTHVGLGSATTAEVRVEWPDGTVGPWTTVPSDQYLPIERAG